MIPLLRGGVEVEADEGVVVVVAAVVVVVLVVVCWLPFVVPVDFGGALLDRGMEERPGGGVVVLRGLLQAFGLEEEDVVGGAVAAAAEAVAVAAVGAFLLLISICIYKKGG